jgi:hypothetical protein
MKSLVASLLAAVMLSACGGGGDDAAPVSITAGPSPQEGLFLAREFPNFDFAFEIYTQLVLENGETWIVNDSTPEGKPTFFVQGPFTFVSQTSTTITTVTSTLTPTAADTTTTVGSASVSTTFTNPSARLSAGSSTLVTGSITFVASATAGNRTSFNRVISSIFTDSFSRAAAPASRFDYDKPAALADIEGSWVFDNPGKPAPQATLEVASTGSVNGSNATTGCSYAGTLTPRPSGKNVFNVALTVTGCADAGAYSGVSYSFLRSNPILFLGPGQPPVPALMLFAISQDKNRVLNLQMARTRSTTCLGDSCGVIH